MTTDTDAPPILTDEQRRQFCDLVVHRAATLMEEHGAGLSMILDRFLTFSAAQAVVIDGKANTAAVFRQLAETVEGGTFDHLKPIKELRH